MKKLMIIFIMLNSSVVFSQQGWEQHSFISGNIVSLNFINDTTGYLFKTPNIIYKTTNLGINWTSVTLPLISNEEINNGMFLDSINGIFITRSAIGVPWAHRIYITNTAGVNWNSNIPNSAGNLILNKSILISDSVGFVCGSDVDLDMPVDGVVYKTTNSGFSWFVSDYFGYNVEDVAFKDVLIGYAGWSSINRTTNSGVNWSYISGSARALYDFSKFFGDTVYIAADSGYIVKTTNGGFNLMYQKVQTNKNFNDIYFINSLTGYVVGDSGKIFRTSNGGVNWINQTSNTTKRLNEIWFINQDTGFIAADSGLLLYTYNGGLTSLISNNQIVPEDFMLLQNFPNPFNPETRIRFSIPVKVNAKLEIFDLTGRVISILVDQQLSPGEYEYLFTSNDLAAGVYFYKLVAGKFTHIQKMVLLK